MALFVFNVEPDELASQLDARKAYFDSEKYFKIEGLSVLNGVDRGTTQGVQLTGPLTVESPTNVTSKPGAN